MTTTITTTTTTATSTSTTTTTTTTSTGPICLTDSRLKGTNIGTEKRGKKHFWQSNYLLIRFGCCGPPDKAVELREIIRKSLDFLGRERFVISAAFCGFSYTDFVLIYLLVFLLF